MYSMETKKSILTLVTPNRYMAKVEHQKHLKFYFIGKLYQIICLPNGLCSDPRKFTKLLKPLLSYIRLKQVTVAGFIDDLVKLGRRFFRCERNIKFIVTLLDSLEFVVHPNTSIFVPARSIEYLAFVIDSQSVTLSFTRKKKACTKQLSHEVPQEEFLNIRKILRLLGKFTSSFSTVRCGNGIKL